MKVIETAIPEVKIIEPRVFEDDRGYFFESFNEREFKKKVCDTTFIQDNEAKSSYGVLRGLHYQKPPFAQAKLVRVIKGEVLDVAVDIRIGSPTFKQWVSVILSEENKRQLFVPRGFAHGYVVLSEEVIFAYKVDNKYVPSFEEGVMYDDNALNIDWQVNRADVILSEKDKNNHSVKEAEMFDITINLH